MRTKAPPVILLACGLLLAVTLAAAPGADNEAEARKIEGLLMAPCCGANTLALHESGAAHEMKREIRELLAAGKNRQQILDYYVAERGETILAVPPSRGFNLLVYVLPALALVLGPLVVWRALRRRVPTVVAQQSTAPPTLDPDYRARLEREVNQY